MRNRERFPRQETNIDQPIESHWNRRRSRNRHRRHASEDLEDKSRSRSNTQITHSIKNKVPFMTPVISMGDFPQMSMRDCLMISMRDFPFKTLMESTDYLTKTFHAISRSKLVASISNEMDPDRKTKILTILKIRLPYRNCHWQHVEHQSRWWRRG